MNNNSTKSFRKSVGSFFKKFNRFCRRFHLVKWLVVVFLSVSLVTSTYMVFLAKTAHVQNLESSLSKTTEIFDVNNKKAGELYAQKGTYVHLNQVSANVPKAVLSTEDRNFYHEYRFHSKELPGQCSCWSKTSFYTAITLVVGKYADTTIGQECLPISRTDYDPKAQGAVSFDSSRKCLFQE